MVLLIATEATLFALLLAAYFYLRFTAEGAWPPDGLADPKIGQPLLATLVLVASRRAVAWAASAAGGCALGLPGSACSPGSSAASRI